MDCQIFSTDESEAWLTALNLQPQADVYFLPQYHRAYEKQGDGAAYAFTATTGGDSFFYPFLLRRIDDRWFDIETVYGYTGPLSTTADPDFINEAWRLFSDWCRERNVVAEFIRFNPLLDNTRYVDPACQVKLNRETVVINLDCTGDELWNSYPGSQRSKIRKALAGSLQFEETSTPEGLARFAELYRETMDRVGADDYYYFSSDYLNSLANGLGDKLKIFTVKEKEENVLAAAIFFVFDKFIHYHLGGSNAGARELRPNNLLFHSVAEWGRSAGLTWLHLGGGRTAAPDDSLLRFKSTFSGLRRPFHTGQRVHNREIYESLCSQWLEQSGRATRPDYFLLYRMVIQ